MLAGCRYRAAARPVCRGGFKLRRFYWGFRSNREDDCGDTAFAERDSDPSARRGGTVATLGREVVKSASQRGRTAQRQIAGSTGFSLYFGSRSARRAGFPAQCTKAGSGRIPCCYRGELWYDPRSFSHDRC